jgi:hypothetical protein
MGGQATGMGRLPVTRLGGDPLSRALRSNSFWLTVGYVSIILLIARTYA